MKLEQIVKARLSLLAACLLAACATKSKITVDGTTGSPVFPKPYSLTFDKDRGTFPTYDELEQMRPGLTKDDIYKILGRPHYDEGMFGVREQGYLFHFHTPGMEADPANKSGVDGITICQYKVVFDKHKFARSFYWNPVFPEDAACPPPTPKAEPQIITREAEPTRSKIRQQLRILRKAVSYALVLAGMSVFAVSGENIRDHMSKRKVIASTSKAELCFADEKKCHPVLIGKITPKGTFNMNIYKTDKAGYGGDIIRFKQEEDFLSALHHVWTLKPPERCMERIASPVVSDRIVTNGCINVTNDVYDKLKTYFVLEVI